MLTTDTNVKTAVTTERLSVRLQKLHDASPDNTLESFILHAIKLEELLIESAATFRFYEDTYRNKIPVSNDVPHLCAKADRNADIASRIEAAFGVTR